MAFYAIAPLGVVAVGSVLAVTRSFAAVETQVQKSYYGYDHWLEPYPSVRSQLLWAPYAGTLPIASNTTGFGLAAGALAGVLAFRVGKSTVFNNVIQSYKEAARQQAARTRAAPLNATGMTEELARSIRRRQGFENVKDFTANLAPGFIFNTFNFCLAMIPAAAVKSIVDGDFTDKANLHEKICVWYAKYKKENRHQVFPEEKALLIKYAEQEAQENITQARIKKAIEGH